MSRLKSKFPSFYTQKWDSSCIYHTRIYFLPLGCPDWLPREHFRQYYEEHFSPLMFAAIIKVIFIFRGHLFFAATRGDAFETFETKSAQARKSFCRTSYTIVHGTADNPTFTFWCSFNKTVFILKLQSSVQAYELIQKLMSCTCYKC